MIQKTVIWETPYTLFEKTKNIKNIHRIIKSRFWVLLCHRYSKGFISCCFFLFLYMLYKNKKPTFMKIFSKSKFNKSLIKSISPFLKTYNPTFYLPSSIPMMLMNEVKLSKNKKILFTKEKLQMQDKGEINLEWYPKDYKSMNTPIVVFLLGITGNSKNRYAKEYAEIVNKNKWRFVIINKRGFDFSNLKTGIFVRKNEIKDFYDVILDLKKRFKCSLFLCGVSAGANYGTKLIGFYNKIPVNGYMSISNPFNFTKTSFSYKWNFFGSLISFLIIQNYKKLYHFHIKNNRVKNKINMKNYLENLNLKIKESKNDLWKMDKDVISKLYGYDNVYEYYYEMSCEKEIKNINIPTLFLNNAEDPICLKEVIPIDEIIKNKNCISLVTERGGHIEYLSDWDQKWWAFELSMYYFKYLHNIQKNTF